MPDTSLETLTKTPDPIIKIWIAGLCFAFVIGTSLAVSTMNLKSISEKQNIFASGQVILQAQAVELARRDAELESAQKKQEAVANEIHAQINRNLDAIMRKLE